ncbi:cytochrome bd-I ubiquinol oxidase subunit 1 apoprotein [Panacagrimonas perspica]|uniref:Cytochrome bd-I ubiquinol oxidase subunit 1 apoprotein n=1 Tax=Panacagrimonas perspica TaxID=381431 RepID=A0A4V3F4U5_9GAMM|nr:cytochrome ubiquinol oxidase subunit I [Panacagrimonas perspica]TDU26536.1 cytochrome bd-I ubiquinol oxidase subunit 1 apoprotein [Panacagrimonas perspica]THD02176.1 cytochrome ubiquinol oxidase subunit I [Panacagrimonas perspica]
MDALLLSRIQFGFTIGFHILFPTLTIGLAWFLVCFEAAWRRTQRAYWLELYRFWVKIFALTFGMGVVSGLVLSYEIGTNFSRFSDLAGPVLGPLLSVEVLTAFFVEAGFLGIMLFGWDKVGPRLHFLASLLVALGTTNSAFWVLSANSFMHTPQGAEWINGQLVPTDWWAVVFNPSFPYRLTHMLLASSITASLVVAGGSAWCLWKDVYRGAGLAGLRTAITVLAIAAPLQIVVGDFHGLNVREHQPIKVAAMEGLWHTTRGAPLLVFAIPDQKAQQNHFEIAVPKLASLILSHDLDGEIQGLGSVPPEMQPPVLPVFFGFRVMAGLGFLFLLLGAWGVWRWVGGKLEQDRLMLRAFVVATPLGFIATLAGWIVAETGRQPWLVHGLIRTHEGVSDIPAASVATSLTIFVLVYGLLLIAYLYYVFKLVQTGPSLPTIHPEVMRGARPAELTQDPPSVGVKENL